MVAGLRVSVIGNESAKDVAKANQSFTLYRTVITYNDEWYERLIRYREFRAFYRSLRLNKGDKMFTPFPKRFCTRWRSLSMDVVESRQVKLDTFMREVCRKDLPTPTQDRLFYLLKIDKYEQHHKDPRFGGGPRYSEKSSTNPTPSSDTSSNASHQISGTATTIVAGMASSSSLKPIVIGKEPRPAAVPEESAEDTSPRTTPSPPPSVVEAAVTPIATSQPEDVIMKEVEHFEDPPDPLYEPTKRPILSNLLTEEELRQMAELRASCLTDDGLMESYSSRLMSSLSNIDNLLSSENKELEELIKSHQLSK